MCIRYFQSGVRSCSGECVSGLFALFCDDIDTEAYCPGEDSCCITHSATPAPPPVRMPPPTTRPPPPTTTKPTRPPGPPPPRCPGFCLLNIMAAFCERPSVLIPHTSNCQRGKET